MGFLFPVFGALLVFDHVSRGWVEADYRLFATFFAVGFLLLHLLLGVHEAGHGLAGRLVGIKCRRIRIGSGWRVFSANIRGLVIEWRALPNQGATYPASGSRAAGVAAHMFFCAGGVLAEALVVLPLLFFWPEPEQFLAGWTGILPAIVVVCAVTLFAYDLVGGLVPRWCDSYGTRVLNDSGQIWDLWKNREQHRATARFTEAAHRFNSGTAKLSPERAVEELREMAREFPERLEILRPLGRTLARLGQATEARSVWQQAIDLTPLGSATRTQVIDEIGTEVLTFDLRDLLPDAELWLRRAIDGAPDRVTLRGTLGSLLVERGREAAGREMLLDVLARTESDVDRAYCEAYLGWLDAKSGRADEARRRLQTARAAGSGISAVNRLIERSRAHGVVLDADRAADSKP